MAAVTEEALLATQNGEAPVAAVIVQRGRIQGVGRNAKTSED